MDSQKLRSLAITDATLFGDIDGKTAMGAVKEYITSDSIDSDVLDAVYSENGKYAVGDTCVHEGAWWRCIVAITTTPHEWNAAEWAPNGTIKEAVDEHSAYYITMNARGDAFPTYESLETAEEFFSGGKVRIPTRNDYAVVLADETHDNAEWRYVYVVPQGGLVGVWQAQYPIETNEYEALSNKPKIGGVELIGDKSLQDIGAQAALNTTQMEAVNSGINQSTVTTLVAHVNDSVIHVTQANKNSWNAKYDKPPGGIPSTDLAGNVQSYLAKAETALQPTSLNSKTFDFATNFDIIAAASTTARAMGATITNDPTIGGGGGGEPVPAIEKLDSVAVAPNFSASSTYAVGYYVTHSGRIYKCTTAVTSAGAWTGSANWEEQTIIAMMGNIENALQMINYGA